MEGTVIKKRIYSYCPDYGSYLMMEDFRPVINTDHRISQGIGSLILLQ